MRPVLTGFLDFSLKLRHVPTIVGSSCFVSSFGSRPVPTPFVQVASFSGLLS